jgi:hypothetical protein
MEPTNGGFFYSTDTTDPTTWENQEQLNRAVFDGYWNQLAQYPLTLPTETALVPAFYSGPGFWSSSMPDETISNTFLWEASAYYSSGTSPEYCSLKGFSVIKDTGVDWFVPQPIAGQTPGSSACMVVWQWAATDIIKNNPTADWDQTDKANFSSAGCA